MEPLQTILSLVAEGGSRALDLLRRGGSALRGLLGNLRTLVRPLLKEAIAFLAAKLQRGAAVVREGGQKVGSVLMRFAERFLGKRQDAEPEVSAEREAEPPQEAASPPQNVAASAPIEAPPVASASPVSASSSAPLAPRGPRAPVVTGDVLSTLGPVVGRALVRALTRPRVTRDMMRQATMRT